MLIVKDAAQMRKVKRRVLLKTNRTDGEREFAVARKTSYLRVWVRALGLVSLYCCPLLCWRVT